MKRFIIQGVGVAVLLLLSSCLKDYDFEKVKLADWNPSMAAPLVSSTLTMADLVENSGGYAYEHPSSGQIYLVYSSKVSTGVIDDYLVIPDQFLNSQETFMMPPLFPGDSFVLAYGHPYEMNLPGNERLDSIRTNGIFNLNIESNIEHSGRIEIELPFLICDGQVVTLVLDHTYSGSIPVIINQQIDLSSCVLVTSSQGSTNNILEPKYKLVLYGDNNPSVGPFTITMGESLTNIDFSSAFGFLGSREEVLTDTILIDAFNSVNYGTIAPDSVILNLLVRNSFGLPVRIVPQELWGYSPSNYPYKFFVTDLATSYTIAAPVLAQLGQFAETRYTIRSASMASMVSNSPTKFHYRFAGQLNPLPLTGSNFILDTSRVDLDVQVEVPLSGSVAGLALEDTVDFEMDGLDELVSAGIKVRIENNFPLEAEFQAYMLDESGAVIDSLFSGYTLVIASGSLGPAPEYRILNPAQKVTDILFSGARLDNLMQTRKILLSSDLRTSGGGKVRVYGDAWMKVSIGANASLNISMNE
jgi:hypothetical protein